MMLSPNSFPRGFASPRYRLFLSALDPYLRGQEQ